MNHEDLVYFRDSIATPRMKEVFAKTEVQEGACYIDKVELSFLDGRSWGVDSHFKATGFEYVDGQAQSYEFQDQDLTAAEFFEAHKDCYFISDGSLSVKDELEEMEFHTVLRNLSSCGKLFHQFEELPEVSILADPIEYYKLRYIAEHGPLKPHIVGMDTEGLAVEVHYGTWHTIDHAEVDGVTCYLMEHDEYGDETACIIVDPTGKLLLEDCYDGLDEETLDNVKHELQVNEFFDDIKRQLDNRLSENAYGESQAFVMLDNGRTIEITCEQDGLEKNEWHFTGSLKLASFEKTGLSSRFPIGYIEVERSEDSSLGELRSLISSLLMTNTFQSIKNPLQNQIQAAANKAEASTHRTSPVKDQQR